MCCRSTDRREVEGVEKVEEGGADHLCYLTKVLGGGLSALGSTKEHGGTARLGGPLAEVDAGSLVGGAG